MADNINTTLVTIDTGQAITNIKEYKKHIEELKGSMLGLSRESDEYKKVAQEVRDEQDKLNEVLSDAKDTNEAVEGSYKSLQNQMAALKKEWRNVDMGSDRFRELSQQIDEINDQLKEADAGIGNFQRNVGNYSGAFAEALGSAAPLISKNNKELGGLAETIGQCSGVLKKMKGVIESVGKAAGLSGTAIKGMMGMFGAALAAIGLIIKANRKLNEEIEAAKQAEIDRQIRTREEIEKSNAARDTEIAKLYELMGVADEVAKKKAWSHLQQQEGGVAENWKKTIDGLVDAYKKGSMSAEEVGRRWELQLLNMSTKQQEALNTIMNAEIQAVETEKKAKEAAAKAAAQAAAAAAKSAKERADAEAKAAADAAAREAGTIEERARKSQMTELAILDETFNIERTKLEEQGIAITNLEKEYAKKRAEIIAKSTKEVYDSQLSTISSNASNDKTNISLRYAKKDALSSTGLSDADRKSQIDDLFNVEKKAIEDRMALYNQMAADEQLSEQQRIDAKALAAQAKIDLDNAVLENEIAVAEEEKRLAEEEKARTEARIQNWLDLSNGIASVCGGIADSYEAILEAQVKNQTKSEDEAKKEFKNIKGLRIAEATIQTISGAIAAFMGCQSLGQPWGAIIGAVQAAAVTAAGVAEIAKIKNTEFGGGSSSSPASGSGALAVPIAPDYQPDYTANITNQSDTDNLQNTISSAVGSVKVYVTESDITEAQTKVKAKVTESSW